MQAIVVKYLGPTNCRGSRYIAKAWAGRVVIECDNALSAQDNARLACNALRKKFGWTEKESKNMYGGEWIMGSLPDHSYVFVCPVKENQG